MLLNCKYTVLVFISLFVSFSETKHHVIRKRGSENEWLAVSSPFKHLPVSSPVQCAQTCRNTTGCGAVMLLNNVTCIMYRTSCPCAAETDATYATSRYKLLHWPYGVVMDNVTQALREECARRNMHLLAINSEGENTVIGNIIQGMLSYLVI